MIQYFAGMPVGVTRTLCCQDAYRGLNDAALQSMPDYSKHCSQQKWQSASNTRGVAALKLAACDRATERVEAAAELSRTPFAPRHKARHNQPCLECVSAD